MPTEKPKSKMIKKRKIASGKRRVPSPRKTVNKSAKNATITVDKL